MTTPTREIVAFEKNFSEFAPSVLGQVVLAASDLCLIVSPERVIEDIFRGGALEDLRGDDWVGKDLRAIVGSEVWHKLDLLWTVQDAEAPVWRHLNFIDPNESAGVPLLVCRVDAGDGRSILVCRDLRPVVRMQQKFNRAMLEMEQSFEDMRWKQQLGSSGLQRPKAKATARGQQAGATVEKAMTEIGHLPLSEILAQTARVLEDMCIRQACEQCDYDLSKAAELLGVSSDDLATRITFEPKRA
ncbi:MAG: hypothetical protein IKG52_12235 [Rhodobacteraceae bacterium]|nr:hypothetical protein [Paracoccaceae bacterium]